MFGRAGLYWRTVRRLKPIQVTNRIWRRVRPRHVDKSAPPPARHPVIRAGPFLARPTSILGGGCFRFLGRELPVRSREEWHRPEASRLWTYHLHYFDGLGDPETSETLKERTVEAWLESNPPAKGPGWEPYPLSLRIVNWIKWTLSRGFAARHLLGSLAIQARCLERSLEYHLLGNHLFANAKALAFAGLYFDGPEAERWLRKGTRLLTSELREQFLPDGGHFELSPVYHAVLTEDLLDLLLLFETYDRAPPQRLAVIAGEALGWLNAMTRRDGLPPLFNDAAYDVAPLADDLLDMGERLGLLRPPVLSTGVHHLAESGYVRHEGTGYTAFVDVGEIGPPYQSGHAHCDMLSFELWAGGRPLIVDTGTSTYEAGPRRTLERGTAAHNTVQVDDMEQSEIWAAFRVGDRGRVLHAHVDEASVQAAVRVFPPRWITHSRTFRFLPRRVVLEDRIEGGTRGQRCTARLHFHPAERLALDGSKITGVGFVLRFEEVDALRLREFDYAPRFNERSVGLVVEAVFSGRLVTEIDL